MNLDDISEVSMDYELFHEMLNWCINKEILSSSYNHGWKPFKNGQQILVNRDYTIKFCFQSSTISDRGNKKHFIRLFEVDVHYQSMGTVKTEVMKP